MIKKISLILLLMAFLTMPTYAWFFKKKQKPVLIFSPTDPRIEASKDEPIVNHDVFRVGDRIYFLIYTPEGFKSDYIKYQVIKQDDKAIFVCGTGIGISIAANKYDEIRCALCYDTHSAKMARNHNNANVLALKGRKACALKTMKIVDTFLNSEFEGGRHEERVNLLSNMRD